jgi:hypothetical protein
MKIFKEADDRLGLILPYGGKGDYIYFEPWELRRMHVELTEWVNAQRGRDELDREAREKPRVNVIECDGTDYLVTPEN